MSWSGAQQLHRYRDNALGVLLFLLVEDYESRFLQAYRQRGFSDVLRSHGAVFRYLESGGAPIGRIAQRAGITKQTAGRFVRELEALGYLYVTCDTRDRRVRLVRFTERGKRLVDASTEIVDNLRSHYESAVGVERFREFAESLERAVTGLAIRFAFLNDTAVLERRRFHHFGRLLVELAEDFEQRLLLRLPAVYATHVTRPMLTLFYRLQVSGQSISELAQGLPVTVQAVSLTVRQLSDRGYLTSRERSEDNRFKRITLTAEGVRLLAVLNEALCAVRADYRESLGDECLQTLQAHLRLLVETLYQDAPTPTELTAD